MAKISDDEKDFPVCWTTKFKVARVKVGKIEINLTAKGHKVKEWQCSLCGLSPRHSEYQPGGTYTVKIVTSKIDRADVPDWKEAPTKPLKIVSEGKVKEYNQCCIKKLGNATYIIPNKRGAAKNIQAVLREAGLSWTLRNNSRELMHSPPLDENEIKTVTGLLEQISISETREYSQLTATPED